MYCAKYIGYVDDVEILLWARLARKLDRAVVKLGGEGRPAAVETKGASAPPAGSQRGLYAIALQPVLIYSDKPVARVEEVLGLECVEEVYGVFEGDTFKVRLVDFGLGFSEVCRRRRPMLKALLQGTVLRLKNTCRDVAVIGILFEIGFGSLYKV
jgi:CRISPR-associated protein Cmr3